MGQTLTCVVVRQIAPSCARVSKRGTGQFAESIRAEGLPIQIPIRASSASPGSID